jgi:hypothetical protein
MARLRSVRRGIVYHVLNRANARATIFRKDEGYAAFGRVLADDGSGGDLPQVGYTYEELTSPSATDTDRAYKNVRLSQIDHPNS